MLRFFNADSSCAYVYPTKCSSRSQKIVSGNLLSFV